MFFFGDRRVLYIMLAICIVFSLGGYLTNTDSLLGLLLTIPAVLVAISFHEFAHAFAAYKLGDETAKSQGRLTLNPLKHIDPIGMVMLLFLGFGWGKPVQVDPRNFNRNISAKKAEAIVSFAGPLINFILAIVFSIIYALLVKYDVMANMEYRTVYTICTILQNIIILNIGLGLFNLIPLPPLDGSKILCAFLPYSAENWFKSYEQIFYIIFLVLWITGMLGSLISPAIVNVYSGLTHLVWNIFGISI